MALSARGKILYSATFLLALPVALVAWAHTTASLVPLSIVASLPIGVPLAAIGALFLLLGMRNLWVHGGGLPMNADPPPRYVARGAYRLLPHPIYTGFCMVCAGVSISVGSASGLLLVTPVAALGCAALVLGYEHHDLRRRFGADVRSLLPEGDATRPSIADRLASYLLVLLPWMAVYAVAHSFGGHLATMPWQISDARPLLLASRIIYASAFVAFAAAPLIARTRAELREFGERGLATMAISFLLFLAIPVMTPSHAATHSLFGTPLVTDGTWSFFPSFAVMWALLFSEVRGEHGAILRWVSRCWVVLVGVSCIVGGNDGIVDVLSGAAAVVIAFHLHEIWGAIQATAERIANSWREWRIGPVRVINHGMYVGMGGFLALTLGGILAGPGHETAILVAALMAVVGAALWAQYVEGSAQLLRPYGFYGGLLGGMLGAMVAPLFHTHVWLLLAVFSAGGTLAQAMGRLRCLVQGCCHGRPAPPRIGIRYVHPRSRVCRFTQWTAIPLHPTPIYSILWNFVVALVVIRLWTLHSALHLITGVYFMLTGVGRFVEEAWRGEPQTRVIAGLRLYQWAAVASVIVGALFTALGTSEPAPDPSFRWNVVLPAAVFGLVVFCAMGVDFPDSNRRFSRLT